jgi:ubiquinone/menaquinone biosynthesis C-methylase UbiE
MHCTEQIEFAKWTAQRLKELISTQRSGAKNILDVGCGIGLVTHYLQEIRWESRIIGVDANREAIAQAKDAYQEMTFFECDEKLPFADGSFDCVYAAYVLHHLDQTLQEKLLREMMRVLSLGGLLIVLELNHWHLPTIWHFWRNQEERDSRMLRLSYLKKLLKNFGIPSTIYYSPLPLCSPVYACVLSKEM